MPKKKRLSLKEQRESFEANLVFLHSLLTKRFSNRLYVCGIDPSLTNTSVAACGAEGSDIVYTNSPAECKDSKNKVYKRIDLTVRYIKRVVPPCVVTCIEGYSYGSTGSNETLAEVGGSIRYNVFWLQRDIIGPVFVIPPTQVKKYILGTTNIPGGTKTKQLIMMNVYKKLGIETQNDNEADAIVLCTIAKDIYKFIKTYGEKTFDGDVEIRNFINKGWMDTDIPKYQWEVLCQIVTAKGDKWNVFRFYNEDEPKRWPR